MIKGFAQDIRASGARLAAAVSKRLPPVVKSALDRVAEAASRRRRAVALPVILIAHLGVFFILGRIEPPPPPAGAVIFDVTLFEGDSSGGAPASLASGAETAEPASEAEATSQEPAEAEKSEQSEDEPPTGESPTEPTDIAATQPEGTAAADSADDVLAMVEALTGASAATVDQPAPSATPVSGEALAWIQSQAGPGGGCDINIGLQDQLTADPVVQAALKQVPRDARSVANAIQLWDGEWVPVTALGGDLAFAPVRDMIAAAVRSAPADCRNRRVEGPRFLLVADTEGSTTVLVIGSGSWRWSDLTPPERPAVFRWFGLNRR